MIVVLSTDGTLTLEDPDSFTGFHLRAPDRPMDWLLATLGSAGKAATEPDHVWLSIDRLHALGEKHGGADWRDGCDQMLAYAETRGWLDEERCFVQAHVEQQGKNG